MVLCGFDFSSYEKMRYEIPYCMLCWKALLGVISIFSINTNAASYSQFPETMQTNLNATNYPQVNLSPIIHASNRENLSIFEIVMLSQIQEFVDNSIGIRRFSEPFWISTSFLTNLLDSSQWSLRKAKRKIRKAIHWRNNNEEALNQLPNKNLFDYFDLEIKGYDKEGCPIVIIPFGKWRTYRSYFEKIKSISEVNNSLKIYFSYNMEKILRKIRENQNSECLQFTLIADMEDYSSLHTSSGLKFFIDIIKLFDRIYPGFLKINYIINSPPGFLKVAQTHKSAIPWDLRRKSFLYTDKSFWKKAILKNVDASELAPKYGGTNFFLE